MQIILRSFAVLCLLASLLPPLTAAHAAGPNCDAAVEGTILYNRTHKLVQFCNGDQWIGLTAKIGGAGDTLSDLSCTSGQVPEWNGSAWICGAGGSGASTVWLNDGPGGPAEIYYNAGYVGIGTNDPAQRLHVSGNVLLAGGSASLYFRPDLFSGYTNTADELNLNFMPTGISGDTTQGYKFSWRNADGSPRLDSIGFHKSGMVTIGHQGPPATMLDVRGTMKLGNGLELCNAAIHEGAIRYVATTDAFEMCRSSSTGWEALGAGGAGSGGWGTPIVKAATTVHTAESDGLVIARATRTGGSLDPCQITATLNGVVVAGNQTDDDAPVHASVTFPVKTSDTYQVTAIADCNAGTLITFYPLNGSGGGSGGSDTLAGLSCTNGQVAAWDGDSWECSTPSSGGGGSGLFTCPTGFTKIEGQGQVLGCLQSASSASANYATALNNCFNTHGAQLPTFGLRRLGAAQFSLAVASEEWLEAAGGSYNGGGSYCPKINSTLNGLGDTCTGSNPYRCFIPAGANGGGSGGSDTLAGLSCTTGQIAKWSGTTWACASDDAGALADNSVTSAKIQDGTITAADTAIIGALTEDKWCTVSGGKIVCSSDAPSGGGSGSNFQTFSSSGTWTKPSTGNMALVECWGGGGGGARDSDSNDDGGGGGGGGYTQRFVPMGILPASVTVTIGAGGLGRTGSDGAGGNGGDTTFGTFLTGVGGSGGTANAGGNGGCGVPLLLDGSLYACGSFNNDLCFSGFLEGTGGADSGGVPSRPGFHCGGGGSAGEHGTAGGEFGLFKGYNEDEDEDDGGNTDLQGGPSIYGGGGGGGEVVGSIGGISIHGGAGGAGAVGAANGANGTAPGGGGGATEDGAGGNGAAGMCRVTVW